jgi:GNAT superfamily N-acetyltransferase
MDWVKEKFSAGWESECDVAFSRQPISCFIASKAGKLIGFSAYDTTAKSVFGPMGVAEDCRTKGIGKALLLAALYDMRYQGYAYAIIGWTGPAKFYEKCANAKIIEGSQPETGMYSGLLGHDPS